MRLPVALRKRSFLPDRPVGLQAVTLAEQLLAHSQDQTKSRNPAESVHQVRLVLKALRALIRLFPNPGSGTPPGGLDDRLKLLGRQLSPVRDREVAQATLRELVRKHGGRTERNAAHAWLRSWVGPSVEPDATTRDATIAALSGLGPGLRRHLRRAASPSGLSGALNHSLCKARRHHQHAERSGKPESFHAWRRWQKRLEAQLRWSGGSERLKPLVGKLHALQEDLGRLHDLDVLAHLLHQAVSDQPPTATGVPELSALVTQRFQRLQRRILLEGRPLLRRRLPTAVRRVRRAWTP